MKHFVIKVKIETTLVHVIKAKTRADAIRRALDKSKQRKNQKRWMTVKDVKEVA